MLVSLRSRSMLWVVSVCRGRGDASERVREDAVALAEAGAFCVLMEMVTAQTAQLVDEAVGAVPTIGIGASNMTTGQVLVWQDMMGVRSGRVPRFVNRLRRLARSWRTLRVLIVSRFVRVSSRRLNTPLSRL